MKSFCRFLNPSDVQVKAAHSVMRCKSPSLGCNISVCTECGHQEIHYNSCRNRNCPNCQAILKELWIDKRKSEVIDAPYFHVVFTVPAQLNPLIYANQKLLYSLLHRCSSETLLELARMVEGCHEADVIYQHHSCGYIEPILPDLVEK